MKTTSEKVKKYAQQPPPVIRSNSTGEWSLTLILLAGFFQLFWTYHTYRGKPYSLCSASECLGFAALTGIAISLSMGPIYRLLNIPLGVLRLRRPMGILGALLTLSHGVLSLFFLPAAYPWSFYLKNWSCLLLGAIGLLGFLYLAWISRSSSIARLGIAAWKRRLRWASVLLLISVLHFMVLGKLSGWVEWAHQLDKVPPGSLLAVGIASFALVWRVLDATRSNTRPAILAGLALCALTTGCGKTPTGSSTDTKLRILCGSSMATPVQELGKQFSQTHNTRIEFDLGGSETLLPKILTGIRADVFVCHDPFEEKLKAAGLWTDSVVVGYLEPVVAVRPGNPKGIHSLQDLTRPGLKIGIGDPRFSTCGELFVNALRDKGIQEGVMANVILQARSHSELSNGLILGPLDAVVVWNFVIGLYPGKLEIVPTGVIYPATRVTVIGLKNSNNAALRDTFLDWCKQPMVQETFRQYGYNREKQ